MAVTFALATLADADEVKVFADTVQGSGWRCDDATDLNTPTKQQLIAWQQAPGWAVYLAWDSNPSPHVVGIVIWGHNRIKWMIVSQGRYAEICPLFCAAACAQLGRASVSGDVRNNTVRAALLASDPRFSAVGTLVTFTA